MTTDPKPLTPAVTDLEKLRATFIEIGVPFVEWISARGEDGRMSEALIGFDDDEASSFVFERDGRFLGVRSLRFLPREGQSPGRRP